MSSSICLPVQPPTLITYVSHTQTWYRNNVVMNIKIPNPKASGSCNVTPRSTISTKVDTAPAISSQKLRCTTLVNACTLQAVFTPRLTIAYILRAVAKPALQSRTGSQQCISLAYMTSNATMTVRVTTMRATINSVAFTKCLLTLSAPHNPSIVMHKPRAALHATTKCPWP